MTHGRFFHPNLEPFRANPLPDAVRRMPLLARSLLVSLQNLVDELFHRFQLGLRPHRNLAMGRDCARHHLSHDPPMHPELLSQRLGSCLPQSDTPAGSAQMVPLASPVHRPSRPGWQGQGRPICRLRRSQIRRPKSGQLRVPKSLMGVGETGAGGGSALRLCTLGAQSTDNAEGRIRARGGKGIDGVGLRTARNHLFQDLQKPDPDH
jgi:hypothetical protein